MSKFKPLTESNWNDLVALFGEKGACGGCWCMWWRLRNKDYNVSKGEKNKELLHALVKEESPLGVIAYENGKPIGWCSVSPRKSLKRLETSRLFKPIDDVPVWSITCLYVNKEYRNKGLSAELISNASEYAFKNGAECIEAYPIQPQKNKMPDVFAYIGMKSAYVKAGFEIVKQVSESRLIMRRYRL